MLFDYDPNDYGLEYTEISEQLVIGLLKHKLDFVDPYYLKSQLHQIRSFFRLGEMFCNDTQEHKDDSTSKIVANILTSMAHTCSININERAKDLCNIYPPLKKYLIDSKVLLTKEELSVINKTWFNPPTEISIL